MASEQSLENSSPFYYATSLWVAFAILTIYYSIPDTSRGKILPGAPVVGRKSILEPAWFTKLRFTVQGWEIAHRGWSKKFRNSSFTIIRPESIITVIPNKYVDELRNISDDRLAAVEALVEDLMSNYTGIDILIGSHLSMNVVKTQLVPRLGSFIPIIEEELDYGFQKEFPSCKDEWVKINLNEVALRVVSRITARLFVGFPLCQNEEWLRLNEKIVPEIFSLLFPRYLHPVVAFLLPSRYNLVQYTKRIHAYLVPLIDERRQQQAQGKKLDWDIITWMMELANDTEYPAENIAQRYIYTIIGSLHTVTAAVVDTVYDLCERPDYVESLRQEVVDVLRETNGWRKDTASKMLMMDSFMKEVQRVNPPSALGFKRIVKDPNGITLSDGFHLPQGTRICTTSTSHLKDTIAPLGQDSFDGFRYYKKRFDPGYSTRYQYTATDKEHIHFGHGKYACPGRFVASNEIKMFIGKMLLKYDFEFPDGQRRRPPNKTILELSFQDPTARILVRERKA
ncbi:cytochrome P450 [Aspergillus cavernicola]|uniref:Cytochrome P450 n=1 Tax=Aspergillus cavernicola TaxID=176166 RepID=A0ABR4HLT4_9EURO